MRVRNENLLELDGAAVNGSLAASKNLQAMWLGHISQFAIQLVFTGTPAGNFKLQASNDVGHPQAASEAEREVQVVNWTDITDSAVTISAAGNVMWNVENVGYNWVRVAWTATGAGTTPLLTVARAYVKGI